MSKLLPEFITACLPLELIRVIDETARRENITSADISEIRLRVNRPVSLTVGGRNLKISVNVNAKELSQVLSMLCRGSVYAHGETLREGYIRVGDGIRVGVCGETDLDGRMVSVGSLNIRIPHVIRGVCSPLLARCLCADRQISSMLIYSPPGIGKTTLLRDLASKLGGEHSFRIAVIDTRGELAMPSMFEDTLCDFLTGYSRAKGIELATRTLSPELIICDELGDLDEARAILTAQNTGVPLIASAHASSLCELLARPNVKLLHESRVFAHYVGISRERINGRLSRSFGFTALTRGEAEAVI